ncbi:hypothetical protein U1Q18_010320 [Sarracenia purpurea var. burkii]
MDKATASKQRNSYARVCVEIEATKPLRKSLTVKCAEGFTEIGVEYESLPSSCTLCEAFGHAIEKCKANKQTEGNEGWIQVGQGNGKAPEGHAHNLPFTSSPVPCEETVLSKGDELNKEAQEESLVQEENPTQETRESFEKEVQTTAHEQAVTLSDSEEEAQEAVETSMEIITDDFDRLVVSSRSSPEKKQNSLKSPPDKKSSSSKRKKKRSNS